MIRDYEKVKCREERHFRERYGVQTPEELEAKILEFELELKRLKEAWELQKIMSRNSLRKAKEGKK